MSKEQRVGVFVDVQNLYYSAKNLHNAKVNFGNVLRKVVDGRKLIRAIAYVIKTEAMKEKTFFEALEKIGYEIRSKDLQIFHGGAKKGDWDVGIAMDAIKLSDKLDVIILVSGDGDYLPLVTYLQNTKGCLVEVVGFRQTTSSKLVEESDDFINLSESGKFLLR